MNYIRQIQTIPGLSVTIALGLAILLFFAAGDGGKIYGAAPSQTTPTVTAVVRTQGAVLYDSPDGQEITTLGGGSVVFARLRSQDSLWVLVQTRDQTEGWLEVRTLLVSSLRRLPVEDVSPQPTPTSGPEALATAEEDAPELTPEPTSAPAEPTPEPTPEPISAPAEPTPEPTPEPTSAPAEPTPELTPEPTSAPAEPTPELMPEPTSAPAEPTPELTPEPTSAPAEPTPELMPEPTSAPAEPTPELMPEPTSAPAEPTPEPTPEPTSAPAEPTPTPFVPPDGPTALTLVRINGANLWRLEDGSLVTYLQAGTQLYAALRSADNTWYFVYDDAGVHGWAMAEEILVINGSSLPVEAIVPTVMPTEMVDEETRETATPTPTGTAAATPEPTDKVVITVNTVNSRLNVRSGPGVAFDIVAKAVSGVTFNGLGRTETNDWIQVAIADLPSGVGWLSADFIITDRPVVELPVVEE